MDIIQTRPMLKKKYKKTLNLSHHHSHSLYLSASPHHLSSPLCIVVRLCLSHIYTFICFGIDFALDSCSSFIVSGLSTTFFPQVNDILFPSFASLVYCSLLVVYLCCLVEFIIWVCVRFWF